jgi:hypothetical protein
VNDVNNLHDHDDEKLVMDAICNEDAPDEVLEASALQGVAYTYVTMCSTHATGCC